MTLTQGAWRVQDELIEQPSWGGRYIIDLKGLSDDPQWQGKKVGQSYEMSKATKLIDPMGGSAVALSALLQEDASGFLGAKVAEKFGRNLSLLIKLTQAKGNSFQVHLPEGKDRGHWEPKPEAWFYLAPGLYTFGMKPGASFEAYSRVLHRIDGEMERLSEEVKSGKRTVENARSQAHQTIQTLDPYAYINLVEAETDDIVDLTAGGIHHSWEEDDTRFPEGNLVYEVQVDVPDNLCSMRGFDKGKFLDDGSLRPTHVADYLGTIEQDAVHNDLSQHITKPQFISDTNGIKKESVFRTPYFCMDRVTISPGASHSDSLADGFHHLFLQRGTAHSGDTEMEQGHSYVLPAVMGDYTLHAHQDACVILRTFLPV